MGGGFFFSLLNLYYKDILSYSCSLVIKKSKCLIRSCKPLLLCIEFKKKKFSTCTTKKKIVFRTMCTKKKC